MPVVFEYIGYITVDDELVPEDEIPDVSESNDSSLLGSGEEIAGDETTYKISGFTSIMVILGLLSLLIIKCP